VRNILKSLVAVTLCCGSLHVSPQELIANRDAGVESLTRNEARLFFTMRLKNWPNGTLVKVFVLPDNNPLHIRFSNEVLGLYPYQLRRVWDRQIFSGTGQAPTTVSSEQEMLERVATTPGAIGYADGPIDNSSIRVLEVR
jgi:ABC-type phosphate transport system substrate-binding protein